jgi:hypothetical protein
MHLEIDLQDPQEAVWLNEWIEEHDLNGVETKVMRETPEAGSMDGGILTGIIVAALTVGATKTIEKLLDLIYNAFASRQKEVGFTLKATCPESGATFELTADKSTAKTRDQLTQEFNQRYTEICG